MNHIALRIAAVAAAVAAPALLSACTSETVEAASLDAPPSQLVALPDGSTTAPRPGSTSAAIAQWLAARDAGARAEFIFRGFEEGAPKLSGAGAGRAGELATMLRASPAVTVELAGDRDQTEALAHFLADRGVGEERVRIVPAAGLGTILLRFDRGSAAPLYSSLR